MTQTSYYWSDVSLGDGSLSPYSDDEFSDIWRKLFMQDRTTMGVIRGYANALLVTNPSGNTIRVATGAALVDGKFYETDANVDNAISTPSTATRNDRIVLRKSWSAQTVRVAVLTGAEGGGVPTLTQTDGVTWEIPLATVTITTGASITITDERAWLVSPMTPDLTSEQGNWILIEEKTGAELAYDFQNIPQTYTELVLIGVLRHQRAAVQTEISMRFNNISSATYNWSYIKGTGTTPSALSTAADTEIELGEIPGASGTANFFGNLYVRIPFYRNTDYYKTGWSRNGNIPNSTTTSFDIYEHAFAWISTNAINRIQIFSSGAAATAFHASSRLNLYGVV